MAGGSTSNGAKIQLGPRHENKNAKWIYNRADSTICNYQTGKALEANVATGKVTVSDKNGQESQRWNVMKEERDSILSIYNVATGKVLDGKIDVDFNHVEVLNKNGHMAQKWFMRPITDQLGNPGVRIFLYYNLY